MAQCGLEDGDLCRAVHEMARGLVDANLGGGLFKKRLARKGQGKRGGFRTIVATRQLGHWFFLYGFAKNDRDNIGPVQDVECRRTAKQVLSLTAAQREERIEDGTLSKVDCDAQALDAI